MTSAQAGTSDLNYRIVIGNEPYLDGDTAALVEYAVAGEAAGRDSVFMGGHLCTGEWTDQPQATDPWITLAGIATRTDDLTLRTWVTTLPRQTYCYRYHHGP